MKINKKTPSIKTYEGAKANHVNYEMHLRRSVMACMLWEKEFYEDGQTISDRIIDLCGHVDNDKIAQIAIEARNKQKLRHVPLLLVRVLARKGYKKTSDVLSEVINRPDEMTEFLAIYWKDGRQPLSAQVKKGLARAFTKFNEYQLAKYNRDSHVKLKDVLFLSHAKPKDDDQAALWKRLIDDKMKTPDTWEVALSSGESKRETFERLISGNKLGALAFLRNLRNMLDSGVTPEFISEGMENINVSKVLPFRFIAAAKFTPMLESNIERLMLKCVSDFNRLSGKTILLVDVSGSMGWRLSEKSDLERLDAAAGLSILAREVFYSIRIFTFSNSIVEVPNRRGFSLSDSIKSSQYHGGTFLGAAIKKINDIDHERVIVITDEQSHDPVGPPACKKAYLINVASAKNGVGYGDWTHIDGWSESTIDYIIESEKENEWSR